jgi:DnaJ-class molecular chaperone
MDEATGAFAAGATRVRAALARLLARLRPEGPCLRCAGTGAWRGLDCPDCGGNGKR